MAKVRYAFGGGAGAKRGRESQDGGDGGGHVSAKPCGALEITREGTRFVPVHQHGIAGAALAIGVALGALLVLMRKPRIESAETGDAYSQV